MSFVILNWQTDGWYGYYVLELPLRRMRVSASSTPILSFWTADMRPYAIALATGLAVIIRTGEWRHLALVGGLVLSAWSSRIEGGAWNNTVLPAYLALAVLLGLSLRADMGWARTRTALAAAQLLLLVYDPRGFVPTAQHRAAGEAFLQSLRSLTPPVLILDHNYWATQANLPEFANGWAVTDIVWAHQGKTGKRLEAEIREAIEDGRFAVVLLDGDQSWFFRSVTAHYQLTGEILSPLPLSGAPRRARDVYERVTSRTGRSP